MELRSSTTGSIVVLHTTWPPDYIGDSLLTTGHKPRGVGFSKMQAVFEVHFCRRSRVGMICCRKSVQIWNAICWAVSVLLVEDRGFEAMLTRNLGFLVPSSFCIPLISLFCYTSC